MAEAEDSEHSEGEEEEDDRGVIRSVLFSR